MSLDVLSGPRTRVFLENVAAHVHRTGITMIAPAIVTCAKMSPSGTTLRRFPNSSQNHQLRIRRARRFRAYCYLTTYVARVRLSLLYEKSRDRRSTISSVMPLIILNLQLRKKSATLASQALDSRMRKSAPSP